MLKLFLTALLSFSLIAGTLAQQQSRFEDLSAQQQNVLRRMLDGIVERRGGTLAMEELIAVSDPATGRLTIYVPLHHEDEESELITCALGTAWGDCNVRDETE